VERVRVLRAVRQAVRAGRVVVGRVEAAVVGRDVGPDGLEDVDLAARGPVHRVDLRSEHPERGPESFPEGHLGTRLEASVGLREQPLRLEARARVETRAVPAGVLRRPVGRRRDHEQATLLDRVLGAVRVVLALLVAPAAAAHVVRPLRGVDGRAVGAVELVGPRQRPARDRAVLAGVDDAAVPADGAVVAARVRRRAVGSGPTTFRRRVVRRPRVIPAGSVRGRAVGPTRRRTGRDDGRSEHCEERPGHAVD